MPAPNTPIKPPRPTNIPGKPARQSADNRDVKKPTGHRPATGQDRPG